MSASQAEPMWFCHECESEMRPLMVPDPQCPRCHSSFVEKIENPNDDPRNFHHQEGAGPDGFNPFTLFAGINDILRAHGSPVNGTRSSEPNPSSESRDRASSPHTTGVRFEFGGPNGRRTIIIGGGNTLHRTGNEEGRTPNLSDFLHANADASGGTAPREPQIPGNLMIQYLMNMMGATGGHGMPPFFDMDGPDMGQGRWGDYVFSQEALDQLMTQLMEGANSNRPVPATDEIMEKLPREVLEEGSPLLEKDCAVCKDQFSTTSEDPSEQVVVTLPCKHAFHEGCIMPWLKSSGTCPVCRHQLVPQPGSHNPGERPQGSSRPSSPNDDRQERPASAPAPGAANSSGGERPSERRPSSTRQPSGDNRAQFFGGPQFFFSTHPLGTPSPGSPNGGPGALFNILFGGANPRQPNARNNQQSQSGSGSQGSNQSQPGPNSGSSSGTGGNDHIPGGWSNWGEDLD